MKVFQVQMKSLLLMRLISVLYKLNALHIVVQTKYLIKFRQLVTDNMKNQPDKYLIHI